MNYYQEITLIEQADVGLNYVHSAVYEGIHTALCDNYQGLKVNIGVSFPMYEYAEKADKGQLGNKMRLFAKTKQELALLDIPAVLDTYADYIHITSIKEVGSKATHYEVYSRYRHRGHYKKAKRLQAHLIKKYGSEWFDENLGSYDAVLANCIAHSPMLNPPFITLKSHTNGQEYHVQFSREKLKQPTESFSFNGYGLSSKKNPSAVPAW